MTAKATISTDAGTTVTIEGTDEEVAALIMRLEGGKTRARKPPVVAAVRGSNRRKPTLGGLVSELIAGGFFEKPKELGAVRLALEEQGHFYPTTTLSPVMLRLVRRKGLRRIKDKKRWRYVRR